MSGSYLYVVSPEATAAVANLVADLRASTAKFNAFFEKSWGRVPYPHETFLRDSRAKHHSSSDVYYLAHALKDRGDHEATFMDVELRLLFLEGYWLDQDADCPEEEGVVSSFFDSLGNVMPGPDEGGSAFKATLREAGLPAPFARDAWLLNKLCNRRATGEPLPRTRYPIWIMAGWDNCGGYLTGKEMRHLDPLNRNGFLAVFRRAVTLGPPKEHWQLHLLDRFRAVREKMLALGDESLCICISGQ